MVGIDATKEVRDGGDRRQNWAVETREGARWPRQSERCGITDRGAEPCVGMGNRRASDQFTATVAGQWSRTARTVRDNSRDADAALPEPVDASSRHEVRQGSGCARCSRRSRSGWRLASPYPSWANVSSPDVERHDSDSADGARRPGGVGGFAGNCEMLAHPVREWACAVARDGRTALQTFMWRWNAILRDRAGSGRIRQGNAEVVRNGAQIWSTIAAETLT